MLSVVREASSLEFSSSVHRAPWSRHTSPDIYVSLLSHPCPSPGQHPTPTPRFITSSFSTPQPTAPPSCFSLLHPSLLQPALPVASFFGPSPEDPVILLFPAHICPPGPTFPACLPLKFSLCKRLVKMGTCQLFPEACTNAFC